MTADYDALIEASNELAYELLRALQYAGSETSEASLRLGATMLSMALIRFQSEANWSGAEDLTSRLESYDIGDRVSDLEMAVDNLESVAADIDAAIGRLEDFVSNVRDES